MSKKLYSSYSEIEHDLEVLRLEREIHYRKLVKGVERTGEQMKLGNLVEGYLGFSTQQPQSLTGKVIRLVAPLIVKFLRKKEGKKHENEA